MSSDDNLPLILRHQSAWQIDSLSEGHNYAPLLAKIYVSRKWPREFSTCRSPWQTRTYLISPSSPPPSLSQTSSSSSSRASRGRTDASYHNAIPASAACISIGAHTHAQLTPRPQTPRPPSSCPYYYRINKSYQ
jgi:hypothetical protein